MINLCLVVIATQFSETKKREMERMRQERARFTSSSTLASSTNNSEPTTCYAEIVKYIAHLYRRLKRRCIKKLRLYKYGLLFCVLLLIDCLHYVLIIINHDIIYLVILLWTSHILYSSDLNLFDFYLTSYFGLIFFHHTKYFSTKKSHWNKIDSIKD